MASDGITLAQSATMRSGLIGWAWPSKFGATNFCHSARHLAISASHAPTLPSPRDGLAKARQVAAQFPRLRSRLETASADYAAAPDYSFEFGLQTLLDGLAAQLTPGRAAAAPGSPANA